MLALTYRGPKRVRIEEHLDPRIEHPNDVLFLSPKGATAQVRAIAYRIPDRFVRHWVLLRLADRMDARKNLPGWLAKPNSFPTKNAKQQSAA